MEDDTLFEYTTESVRQTMQERADEILNELNIPVEGFFNYYSVPWDEDKYVKFPAKAISTHLQETKLAFISSFDEDTCPPTEFEKNRDKFMHRHYLGSARATDTHRLKYVVGDRQELVCFKD